MFVEKFVRQLNSLDDLEWQQLLYSTTCMYYASAIFAVNDEKTLYIP